MGNDTIKKYVQALEKKSITKNEIKRRLFSVDKLLRWAHERGYLAQEDFKQISTEIASKTGERGMFEQSKNAPPPVPFDFKSLGIRHYIGFTLLLLTVSLLGAGLYNQFFKRTATPFAYTTPLSAGKRLISFQGRLTDSIGNPIIAPIDITYKFYSTETGGSPLTDSTRVCTANPDQDGIFSTTIGSDTGPNCSDQIPSSIFTDNTEVWLGLTVGSEVTEMDPRQQIANVGYAINAETLQGLAPGTSTGSVPFINSGGDMWIGTANPAIRSTYASADFTISSARATTIQSAGGGDIVLSATDGGTLRFNTFNGTLQERMTITPQGNIGINNINPRASLDVIGDASLSGNLIFNGATTQITQLNGGNLTFATSVGGDLGSTAKMTLSNLGNLGIGTTVPGYRLDVAGSASVSGNLTMGGQLQVGRFAANPLAVGAGSVYYNTLDNSLYVYNSANWIQVGSGTGSGESVWQRVLDGVVIPKIAQDALNLGNSATASATVHLAGKAGDNSFFNTGNVGIGTTNPSSFMLQVNGNVGPQTTGSFDLGSSSLKWNNLYVNNIIPGTSGIQGYWQRNSQALSPTNITDDLLTGATATASALVRLPGVINQNAFFNLGTGNVAIGTTTPLAKLHVALTDTTPTSLGFVAQNTGGTELITNANDRNFSGAGNWTGSSWAISSGVFQHTAGDATAATLANANLTASSIINGRTYAVTFTISGMNTGTITPRIGTATGSVQSANGTYTVYITANANDVDLTFTPTSAFDGALDNISVTRVTNYVAMLNSGKLGIGLNNPTRSLDITDNTVSTGQIMNLNSSSITSGIGLYMTLGSASNPFTGNFLDLRNNGTQRLTINSKGAINATYTTSSNGEAASLHNLTYVNSHASATSYYGLTVNSTQQTIASSTTYTLDENIDNTYEAFKINTGTYTRIQGLRVRLKKATTALDQGYVTLTLRADDGGSPSVPTGAALATSGTLYAKDITTTATGTYYYFTLNATVTANTNYWVSIQPTTLSNNDIVVLGTAGTEEWAYYAGSTWTNQTGFKPNYYLYSQSSAGLYAQSYAGYGGNFSSVLNAGIAASSTLSTAVSGTSTYGTGAAFAGLNGISITANGGGAGVATYGISNTSLTQRAGQRYADSVTNTWFTGDALNIQLGVANYTTKFAYYDGATFTDQTTNARYQGGTAYTLLADTNDYFYFGRTSTTGSYRNIIFDIANTPVLSGVTWEYATGEDGSGNCNAWTSFTPATDETNGLTRDGQMNFTGITFSTQCKVDGTDAYWMRVSASSVTTGPTAYASNYGMFSGYFARMYASGAEKIRIDNAGHLMTAGYIYPGSKGNDNEATVQATRYLYDNTTSIGMNTDLTLMNPDTSITSGQLLSRLEAYQSDSNAPGIAGAIRWTSDNTISGASTFDTKLIFSNTVDGTETDRMAIASNGNVGIGTTNPITFLDIRGDASSTGTLTIGQNNTIRSQYGPLNLAYKSGLNAWTTGMVLQDGTGNVGIGTTNPSYKVDISGGNVRINGGVLGVNTAPSSNAIIYTGGSTSGSTSQYGLYNYFTAGTDATSNIVGYQVGATGANSGSPYTTGWYYGASIQGITKGTNQTVTRTAGINIAAMTAGATDNYGIYINAPSGGSNNNIGLYNAGTSYFGGNVGVGSTSPTSFALEVAGNIGPDADNTRDLGSVSRHYNTIYANNLVGIAALSYWQRVAGVLSPFTQDDGVAATSSATTVATFTASGTNDALRTGGSANYATISSNGDLTFTGANADTINKVSGTLNINTTNNQAITTGNGQITLAGNVDATNGLDVTTANLTVGGANFTVVPASGNITTAGTLTLPNSQTLTGVANYVQHSAGISVGGGTTYNFSSTGTIAANTTGTINSLNINAGALSGVTGYAQTTGTFAFSGAGNFSIDSAGMDVTTAGAVSNVTTLGMNNQFTNSYANSAAINLTGNAAGITFAGAGSNTNTINTSNNNHLYFNTGTGNIGISSATPTSFKLEVAGNIGPDGDNTRDIGSVSRHYNTIYANNIVGIDALSYWQRVTGVLSPFNLNDALAATSGATTVAAFTSTGTNDAVRAGGSANYITVSSNGDLSFTGANADSINKVSGTLNINTVNNQAITTGNGQITLAGNVDATNGLDVTTANLTVGGANFTVVPASGNVTTAGTLTLPNSNTLTGVASYTQFSNGISVGGGTTYRITNTGVITANTTGTINGLNINAGALSNVTGYSQTSGTFAFSGAGNFSVDSAAFDVTTAGAVSGVTTLGMNNQLTNSYADSAAINLSGNAAGITFSGAGANTNTINTSNNNHLYINTGTGNVGIGSATPTSFKLEVAGNIGPDGDNTRDIGSLSHYYNTLYVNNIVGTGALGYWARGTGILYPVTTSDGLAATSSAATVATFTAGGTNDALRTGGVSNYVTVNSSGSLTFNGVTNDIATGTNEHLSLMPNGTGNVGVGTTSPLEKLDVAGSATIAGNLTIAQGSALRSSYGPLNLAYKSGLNAWTTGMVVKDGTGYVGVGTTDPTYPFQVLSLGVNASSQIVPGAAAGSTDTSNGLWRVSTLFTGNNNQVLSLQGSRTQTTVNSAIDIPPTFAPTSGSVAWSALNINPTVNQTGGANGTTRGLYINPTLTSAPNFRGIEIANNAGYGLYQSGASASNYFAGNVGIGTATPTSFTLEVAGNIGPDGNNTRDLGSVSRYYNTIYANNIVGSGTIGYWSRGTGILYPSTLSDGLAATTSATTVATFTSSGTNDALRVGGVSNYLTVGSTGILTFNGVTNDITTGTNEHLSLMPNGTGNVGIGTTSPLEKLDIVGSASLSANLTIGQAGAIRSQYGPLNLAYKSGLNAWTTGLTLQDTTGNVGIGTTSPRSKLQVNGSGTSVWHGILIGDYYNGVTNTSALSLHQDNATNIGYIEQIKDGTGYGNIAVAPNGGNVGIGTTSPLEKLDIVGSASLSANLTIGQAGVLRSQYGPLNLAYKSGLNAWTTGITLKDTTGNVGIGTTNPSSKIQAYIANGSNTLGGIIGSTYQVNGVNYGSFGANSRVGLVGAAHYGNPANLATNPLGTQYATAGIVGIGGGSSGSGWGIGVAGFAQAVTNATGQIAGGKFTVNSNGDLNNGETFYGVLSNATGTTNTVNADTVYGIHSTATGQGTDVTYGGYFTASGGGTNYGIYSAAGVNYFNGNVGINTTVPAERLDIVGNASTSGYLTIGQTGALRSQYGPLNLAYKSGLNAWTTGMVLEDLTGYVGIGTTDPQDMLNVKGGNIQITAAGTAQNLQLTSLAANFNGADGSIGTSSTFNLTLNPGGNLLLSPGLNVGIGTASPAYKLDIQGWASASGNLSTGGQFQLGRFASDPSPSLGAGSMYYNSSDNSLYYHNGSNWNQILGGGGLWTRTNGVLSPLYNGDVIAATSGATTVATFTQLDNTKLALNVGGAATMSGTLTLGNYSALRPAYGPLSLAYKSGLNTWATGITLQDSTGYVGIGTIGPQYLLNVHQNTGQTDLAITTNVNVGAGNATQLLFGSDMDGTPGYSSIGQFNTGDLKLSAIGNLVAPDMTILATNGNVGIGTTSPLEKLNVVGSASLSANLTIGQTGVLRSQYGPLNLAYKSGLNAWTTGLTLQDTTGYVGMGTTSPSNLLDIELPIGDTSGKGIELTGGNGGAMYLRNNTSTANEFLPSLWGYASSGMTGAGVPGLYLMGVPATDNASNPGIVIRGQNSASALVSSPVLQVRNYTTNLMTVTADGNVGIGTTGPQAKAHILDTSAGSIISPLYVMNNSAADNTGVGIDFVTSSVVAPFARIATQRLGGNSDGNMMFSVRNDAAVLTERMRIDSEGNVGIGTTSPLAKLDISGSASLSGSLTIGQGGSLQSQYGPLSLAYKSAWNTWTTGLTLQDTTGSVGIGSSHPMAALDIANSWGGKPVLSLNQRTDSKIFIATSSATTRFTIANNGNIGIGPIEDPLYPLDILQAAGSDSSIALRDGDVAHGVTSGTGATTDTYGLFNALNSTDGGLKITGLSEASNNIGLTLRGVIGQTTTSVATIKLVGAKENTNAQANLGSTESVLEIANNTDTHFKIQGNGNVGISSTTTVNADAMLDLNGGNMIAARHCSNASCTFYYNPGGTSHVGGDLEFVTDGTDSIGVHFYNSSLSQRVGTIQMGDGSNGAIRIGKSSGYGGTEPDLCIGSATCTGKIDAGTIDPPYTINGKKYATYLTAMTGVKEETTGLLLPSQAQKMSDGYAYVIDFNTVSEGSDLWLFSKASNLKANISRMSVLLTPSENIRTWYKIDNERRALIVYSSRPSTISYRLSAPRFNDAEFGNRRPDGSSMGFVINDPDINAGSYTLTDNGSIHEAYRVEAQQSGDTTPEALRSLSYAVKYIQSGDLFEESAVFADILVGRLKTGLVESTNLVITNIATIEQAVIGKLSVGEKIITPVIETSQVKTDTIKPKEKDITIDLSTPPAQNNPDSGSFAKLIIQGLDNKPVASIDAMGNATFAGTLTAQEASISGSLIASEASISGTLVAKEVQAENINSFIASQSSTLAQLQTTNSQLSTDINSVQQELANLKNAPLPNPEYYQVLSDKAAATVSSLLAQSVNTRSLTVGGMADLFAVRTNSLTSGDINIVEHSIYTLNDELNLSAFKRISFFDGLFTIAKDGTITSKAQFIAEEGIRTNEIKPLTDEKDIAVALNSSDSGKLKITDQTGAEVASIDASGSATFESLSFNQIATNAAIIADSGKRTDDNQIIPAIQTNAEAAGTGILPADAPEIIIYNSKVTRDSLIYLTPTSETAGSQLTVVKKVTDNQPYFSVSAGSASHPEIKFNWLIIN